MPIIIRTDELLRNYLNGNILILLQKTSIECLLTLSQFDFVCTSILIILSIYTTHKIR
ncbi:hypothetical protein H1P_4120002 [Hyella patelloides LEGE 07179]|uniref:Uncharacterized protein n=1 Tax=Hyella patelloides LEGE 07179 TaxID=945734 RepID=A0A563VXJ0_9CYAN|nr:hypothetical protein H1P_4120002 [Hyella patelloides LEGE 07179]